MQDPYTKGREAFKAQKMLDDNPYLMDRNHSGNYTKWAWGWWDQKEIESRKEA